MKDTKRSGFEVLCRREYAAVVRTAYLITSDREEASDVAQEAFARAYQRWSSVSGMERPGAWVQRVAANLAISWRRRRRFVSDLPIDEDAMGASLDDSEVEIVEALQFLTPAQRAVLVLRYYGDQPVKDVARALGKQPGTVRALTSQGMSRLREFFEEETDDARR